MKQIYGQIYFFKNGQIQSSNLTITEDKLLNTLKTRQERGIILSDEEEKLLPSNTDKVFPYTPYLKLIEEGYSIIRYQEYYDINKLPVVDIILAEQITSVDRENIEACTQKLNSPKHNHIYNYVNSPYGKRFEFYDGLLSNNYSNKPITSIPTLQVLPYYLKDKTDELTEDEKKMFEKYRHYDLVDVLIGNNQSKYPLINNSNAGVIVISSNKTEASTLKEMKHSKEFKVILKFLHPNLKFNRRFSIMDIVNDTNDILIQLYDHQLILWLPEKLNNYQINELKKLIIQVKEINKNCLKNHQSLVDMYSSFCEGDIAELEDIEALEEYLVKLENSNQSKRRH